MTGAQPSGPASHSAPCDVENETEQKRVCKSNSDGQSFQRLVQAQTGSASCSSDCVGKQTAIPKKIDIMHGVEVMMSLQSLVYQPQLNTLKPYGLWSDTSATHVHGFSGCLYQSWCQNSFWGTDMQSELCMFMPGDQCKFSALEKLDCGLDLWRPLPKGKRRCFPLHGV